MTASGFWPCDKSKTLLTLVVDTSIYRDRRSLSKCRSNNIHSNREILWCHWKCYMIHKMLLSSQHFMHTMWSPLYWILVQFFITIHLQGKKSNLLRMYLIINMETYRSQNQNYIEFCRLFRIQIINQSCVLVSEHLHTYISFASATEADYVLKCKKLW